MIRSALAQTGGFTVGICATGEAGDLGELVEVVLDEAKHTEVPLRKVVIVASACSRSTASALEGETSKDPRVVVIAETERHGKAAALNRIIDASEGQFLVLVNADATPERGAVSRLLSTISHDEEAGVVSANPIPGPTQGPTSLLVDLMWAAHNECALTLNHMNISNQSCDELVVIRSSAVSRLPEGLVNDGAFLAAKARRMGFSVKFCPPAKVRISTPRLLSGVIGQRRRILFGHVQVWRKTGAPPKTVESMTLLQPQLGLRLFVKTVARRPLFLAALPFAAVSELSAALLSIWDTLRSTGRHAVWRRYQ